MNELQETQPTCGCGKDIPQERYNLGFKICISCAERNYVKPKGVMHFDHKTGGQLQILTPDQFANYRQYNPYGKYTGRGSGLHRITRSTSSM